MNRTHLHLAAAALLLLAMIAPLLLLYVRRDVPAGLRRWAGALLFLGGRARRLCRTAALPGGVV